MKNKGLLCAGLLGAAMVFCGTAYAEEQPVQQETQAVQLEAEQAHVYQTEDGVLSIEAPDDVWKVVQDPNSWFVLSNGSSTITVDHLSNGEELPAPVIAGGDAEAVCQMFISTKNEVFVVKGAAAKQENLADIMKMISTLKILKYDTKTAISQNTAAEGNTVVNPINETYYCTSSSLNVRSGHSTEDPSIGTLGYGEAVTVLGSVIENGQDTGWYQISFNGTSAYASAQYLSRTKPENTSSTGSASSSDEYFLVYGTDGISVAIHSVGGATYEDTEGLTYIDQGNGIYYCITHDSYFALDRNTWSYDDNVNVEGDPYGNIDYGEVNVEGDPYGDLSGVNVEG